jgi:hypothetical protein
LYGWSQRPFIPVRLCMKMSFKSLTFRNKTLPFLENVFKKASIYFKMSHINEKKFHLSRNNLKKPEFFEKASHRFKKTSILLKMSKKSLKIASIFLKMSSKSLVIFKKA